MEQLPLRVMRALAFGALALGPLALGAPVAALADVGAGVGASPIVLAAVASPGHTYRLPALYVINTGTVASSYRLRVEQLAPSQGRAVPPGWIAFARNEFQLAPKGSTSVAMTLSVPAAGEVGAYESELVAGTVAVHAGAGASASAQAATKLEFTVGNGDGFPWPWAWWSYAALAVALVAGAGTLLQRRFHFRLQVQRRR